MLHHFVMNQVFLPLLTAMARHPTMCGTGLAIFVTMTWWNHYFLSSGIVQGTTGVQGIFPVWSNVVDIANGSLEALFDLMPLHPLNLVIFYAPWCGESIKVVPEFLAAYQMTKGNSHVSFIGINCWIGTCKSSFRTHHFPRIFLYHTKYNPVEYFGAKDAGKLAGFIYDALHPFSYIGNEDQLTALISASDNTLICFLNPKQLADNRQYDVLLAVALYLTNRVNKPRLAVLLNDQLASTFNLSQHGQLALQRVFFGTLHYPASANFTSSAVIEWIFRNYQPVVMQLAPNATDLSFYMEQLGKGPIIVLCLSLMSEVSASPPGILREFQMAALSYRNCSCPIRMGAKEIYLNRQPIPAGSCSADFYLPVLCTSLLPVDIGYRCEVCQSCTRKCSCTDFTSSIGRRGQPLLDGMKGCISLRPASYCYEDRLSLCCSAVAKPPDMSDESHPTTSADVASSEHVSAIANVLAKLETRSAEKEIESIFSNRAKEELDSFKEKFGKLMQSLKDLIHVNDEVAAMAVARRGLKSSPPEASTQLLPLASSGVKPPNFAAASSLPSKPKRNVSASNSSLERNRSFNVPSTNFSCGRSELPCCLQHVTKRELREENRRAYFNGLACRTNKSLGFYYMDSSVFGYLLESAGAEPSLPLLMIIDMHNEEHYVMNQESSIETTSVIDFVLDFTAGTLLRHMRSSAVSGPCRPTTAGQVCIVEVTSKTFSEIVLNQEQDVMLMYYTPWCGFCKSAYRVYLHVAEAYRHVPSLVFARIDADANDLPWQYVVDGYPALILFPRKRKFYSVPFSVDEEISVDSVTKFIDKYVRPTGVS